MVWPNCRQNKAKLKSRRKLPQTDASREAATDTCTPKLPVTPGVCGSQPLSPGNAAAPSSCRSCPPHSDPHFLLPFLLGSSDSASLCSQLVSGPTTLHNRRCGEGWWRGGPESGPVFSFLCSGRICFSATFPSKHSPAGRCLLHRFLNDEMI